ncbi:unnamed protein product [Absidia cylindrospora]
MSRECRYICQRAANAIISEVGSYRVSTDALHGINQFLDEFWCNFWWIVNYWIISDQVLDIQPFTFNTGKKRDS